LVMLMAEVGTTRAAVISPSQCNLTTSYLTVRDDAEYGYAGMVPMVNNFCISKRNGTFNNIDYFNYFDFFLTIDLGNRTCRNVMTNNTCGDLQLANLITNALDTMSNSLFADAIATHLAQRINRTDWLVIVIPYWSDGNYSSCGDDPNFCQVNLPGPGSNYRRRFVTAVKLQTVFPTLTTIGMTSSDPPSTTTTTTTATTPQPNSSSSMFLSLITILFTILCYLFE